MTSRRPVNGREVAGHVGWALSSYIHRAAVDGITLPEELTKLATWLADCATSRQEQTPLRGSAGSLDAEVMEPLVLSRRQVATVLQCSTRTVDRLITSGALPTIAVLGTTRVRKSDLERFVGGSPTRSFIDDAETKEGAA